MAFHPYPQVIRAVFNPHRFGPPLGVTPASPCSWVDRPGFGSTPGYSVALVTGLAFAAAPLQSSLASHPSSNSPDHNAKGTPSGTYAPSDRLSAHGFRISFTRHLACFSPFPHGTRALSVIEEYLGLEGGPPGFAQNSTCSALLGIPLGAVRVQLPGCHRLWRAVPGRFTLASCIPCCGPTTPRGQAPTVWPLPRSLTATRRISVDFCSSRY